MTTTAIIFSIYGFFCGLIGHRCVRGRIPLSRSWSLVVLWPFLYLFLGFEAYRYVIKRESERVGDK